MTTITLGAARMIALAVYLPPAILTVARFLSG